MSFFQIYSVIILAALFLNGTSFAADKHPNILFVLADDLGWRDLGCYGSDFYETPNIDRLASQGMRFTDAYAAANVCSPTRAAILTGKTPARLHLTDFLSGLVFPHAALTPPEWQRHFLPLEEVTLAEMLGPAGYESFYFGKWHLGRQEYFPTAQGFEHGIWVLKWGFKSYFYPWPASGDLPGKEGDYFTDAITDRVIEALEQARDRPFFIFLSYFNPHRPTEAKEQHVRYYERKLTSAHLQRNPINAGMIHSLDENIGRIMRALDDENLAEDTLVIFTSDNGGNHYADVPQKTSNSPLRAGKGSAYEGAYRVPLIVRWPRRIPEESESREPVSSIDFFPTLAELSEQDLPAEREIDGTSLLSVLTRQQPLDREALYWHYPHYHNGGASPHGVVRKGRYRLVEHFDGTPAELYDLESDLGETVNLAYSMEEKTKELLTELREWRGQVGAQMPTGNPNYDPERVDHAIFYHQYIEQQSNRPVR
ncbi:MAG: sulfatase [Verrucomicrobiota bacterium]